MRSKERCLGLVSLSMLLLLAACGGQPPRPVDTPPAVEPASTTTKPARKPSVVQKRGGGYYKDDGPGDDIPENLDDIPDAQPRSELLHRFANKPYVVLGKSYVPETSVKPFQQRGIASWYGKKFHGQKTSIGEPYDMFSMTAAHPTLAIPSYVRVTSVSSGKSVIVRLTDRGPFHADRIIDLSYAAAHRLGYVNNGSTLVEVEAILPGDASSLTYAQVKPPPPTARPLPNAALDEELASLAQRKQQVLEQTPVQARQAEPPSAAATTGQPKGMYLQLGAFSNRDNAENLRSHFSRELDWLNESIQINANGGVHRVHLGPYASRADAEVVAERIRTTLGYKPAFVMRPQ